MVMKILLHNIELPRMGNKSSGYMLAHFLMQLEIFQGPVVILGLFCEKGLWAPCVIDSSISEERKFPHE